MDANKQTVASAVADWLCGEAAAASNKGDSALSESLIAASKSVEVAYKLGPGETRRGRLDRLEDAVQVLQRFDDITATKSDAAAPPSPPHSADSALREAAEKIKNKGNELMGRGDIHGAITKYSEAISMCGSVTAFYGNRAVAYARLGMHEDAIRDCDTAIRIDPAYAKGFGRKGMSLMTLGCVAEARAAFSCALDLDPGNAQYKEALLTLSSAKSMHSTDTSTDALRPPRQSLPVSDAAIQAPAAVSPSPSSALVAIDSKREPTAEHSPPPVHGRLDPAMAGDRAKTRTTTRSPSKVAAVETPVTMVGLLSDGKHEKSTTAVKLESRSSGSVNQSADPDQKRGRRLSMHLPQTALPDLGLELLPAQQQLYGTVVAVGRVGPLAQVSGLMQGDIVSTMNGEPCTTVTIDDRVKKGGKPVHLCVIRPDGDESNTGTGGPVDGSKERTGQFAVGPVDPASNMWFSLIDEVLDLTPPQQAPPADNVPVIGMDKIKPQVVDGVRFFRVPVQRFDTTLGDVVYSFEYRLESERNEDLNVSVCFEGEGFSIAPADDATVLAADTGTTVSRVLLPRFQGLLTTVSPTTGHCRPGKYSSRVRVEPWGVREEFREEVEGVTLVKTVTRRDVVEIAFAVTNTNPYPIRVSLLVQGEHDATQLAPVLFVGAGATMSLGRLTTHDRVEMSWQWKNVSDDNAHVSSFDMEGVTLHRTLHPSTGGQYSLPGSATFAVSNPNSFEIEVKISLSDMVGRSHNMCKRVGPCSDRLEVASDLAVSGKVRMRWSWKRTTT